MLEAILHTLVANLAVIGIADFIRLLIEKILGGAKRQLLVSLIPCKGHEEELEYLVATALTRLGSHCSGGSGCILLVDCGMDEESRIIGELICRKHPCVELCEECVLGDVMKEKFHLQNS